MNTITTGKRKSDHSPRIKRIGVALILICAFIYVLYQIVTMIGIIKSF